MNTAKRPIVILIILFLITGFSYVNFAQYKPKTIRQIPDVKSAATSTETLGFQIPQGSDKLSIQKSGNTNQVVFQTQKSKTEIQDFYKTIYSEPKWAQVSESSYKDFIIVKYRSGENSVSITAFDLEDEDNNTLVSIEETLY